MKWTWQAHELHPRHVFRISRANRRVVRNVLVRVEHAGIVGLGEAAPNEFYGESAEAVIAALERAQAWLEALEITDLESLATAWARGWEWLAPSRAAQCAVDVALWDWLARRRGVTVAELAWGESPRPVRTFATIGLSSPEEFSAKLADLRGFPLIKLKAGAGLDGAAVDRAVGCGATVAVDANGAWSAKDLPGYADDLARRGVAFLEQPLAPGAEAMLPARRALPIVADESCVLETDVEGTAAAYDGFNIKLAKCGGFTPARRMLARGRALGRRVMVGCMLESSVLIAAGAALGQRTDFADLDGAWLLADDPARGWAFDRGVLVPPARSGLGVEL